MEECVNHFACLAAHWMVDQEAHYEHEIAVVIHCMDYFVCRGNKNVVAGHVAGEGVDH